MGDDEVVHVICAKCRILCENVCPLCGRTKHVREAEPTEPAHLFTLSGMQAMFVEPILTDIGVPYYKQNCGPSGLTTFTGTMDTFFRFFVPASAHEKCVQALEDVFGEDEQIMRLLHEFDH